MKEQSYLMEIVGKTCSGLDLVVEEIVLLFEGQLLVISLTQNEEECLGDSDPLALHLLERLLAFDPEDRISAEEVRIAQ